MNYLTIMNLLARKNNRLSLVSQIKYKQLQLKNHLNHTNQINHSSDKQKNNSTIK
jgi:hypothetical protein